MLDKTNVKVLDKVVVRFSGDSGDGMQLAGNIFTNVSAGVGNEVSTFPFMADAYAKVSSVRDGIESERNLQGFFMAYLNLNDYYITAPELELNHGYCDFFLLPDHTHYASQHSYILELKVLSRKEFDEELKDVFKEDGSPMKKSEKQWLDAVEQIRRYADAPRVEALRQGTTLHKIIMQFKGWELARIEEIE